MSSVGHSRLLKYLVPTESGPQKNKMADSPKFNMDLLNPNIKSEVPGPQALREIETLTPVLQTTKNETTFTKKDGMKLQKDEPKNVYKVININAFNGIESEVISGPHPQRTVENNVHKWKNVPSGNYAQDSKYVQEGRGGPDGDVHERKEVPIGMEGPGKDGHEEKKKTKIPSNGGIWDTFEVLQRQLSRRSSIPKLQKVENVVVSNQAEDKPSEDERKGPSHEAGSKPEDEFDKIYEEIVEHKDATVLDEDIITDPKIDDKKIETKFEEIIHDYKAPDIKPIDVVLDEIVSANAEVDEEKVISEFEEIIQTYEEPKMEPQIVEEVKKEMPAKRTKIPLLKRQSQEDIKVNRRHSLKNGLSDKELIIVKSTDYEPPNNQALKISDLETSFEVKDETHNEQFVKDHIANDKHELYNKDAKEAKLKDHTKEKNEKIEFIAEAIITDNNYDLKPFLKDDPSEVTLNEIESKNTFENSALDKEKDESHNKYVQEATTPHDIQINLENNDQSVTDKNGENDLPILKGKVSKLINKIRSNSVFSSKQEKPDQDIHEKPKNKSVSSRVAMFEQKRPEPIVRPKARPEIITPIKIQHFDQTQRENVLKSPLHHPENGTLDIKELPISEVVTHEIKLNRKPKVVEQVLKQPIRPEPVNEVVKYSKRENIEREEEINKSKEQVLKVDSVKYEIQNEIDATESGKEDTHFVIDKTQNFITETNEINKEQNIVNEVKEEYEEPKLLSSKDDRESFESIIERRIKRLTSRSETDLYRSQMSIVDIELGNAVRGKVNNIIETMKTVEKFDQPRKEVIHAKERPRKKSVSEKIALFERKITHIDMEPKLATNYAKTKTSIVPENVKDYSTEIAELVGAKQKFGVIGDMPSIEISDGVRMPVLAVGTALLEPKLARYIVEAAIELGYRAIDTAYIYGNEREVGEAIRNKIEDGTVKRSDLFVTCKLWSTFHRPDLVEAACRRSLDALQLDYFDLYMIHNPMSFKEGGAAIPTIANVLQYSSHSYLDAWRAMEALVSGGLTRSVGVSNFNVTQLASCGERGLTPAVNQVECHPYLNQDRLASYCDANGITLACYGTLGSKGTPLGLKSEGAAAEVDDPRVSKMAAELGVSPARVLISYQLSRGHAVVVKASSAAHLWDNLQALSLTLDNDKMQALAAMNRNKRNFAFKGMGDTHRNYPFNSAF